MANNPPLTTSNQSAAAPCQPPDPVQFGLGIVAALIVLLVIQRTAPELTFYYILALALGIILTHSDCFAQQLQTLFSLRGN